MTAKNNKLIKQFLKDSRFEVTEAGIFKNGKRLGRKDKEGYIEIYYKSKRLKEHRIIYAKFKGKLEPELVVHHKNASTADNTPINLTQTTQQMNLYYRDRRLSRKSK